MTTSTSTKIHRYRGWMIMRGAYYGTTGDRADRWYIDPQHAAGPIDHTGSGYVTLADARASIDMIEATHVG